MNDGEMAVVTADDIRLLNIFSLREMSQRDTKRRQEKLEWSADKVQKNGHPHFMLKEILEQPKTVFDSFRG
jgi:glucosamine--fructose-6-phosphate aminotransferase (isomerizing)